MCIRDSLHAGDGRRVVSRVDFLVSVGDHGLSERRSSFREHDVAHEVARSCGDDEGARLHADVRGFNGDLPIGHLERELAVGVRHASTSRTLHAHVCANERVAGIVLDRTPDDALAAHRACLLLRCAFRAHLRRGCLLYTS